MSTVSEGKNVMVQGRIVWVSGDLFKGRPKTNMQTRQPILNDRGEQKIEYGFGLAVPKSVLNQVGPGQPGEIWAAMHEEAYKLFPSRQIPPAFSMKYKDGDGIDDKGVSFAAREGYAGHIVLACTTGLPIKFYRYENGQNFQINEGIKCGDYVNVQLNVKAHPAVGQGKAGLYLNPNAVQFLGFGKEIINAPSGDQIFGVQAPAIPQGASATPIAPAGFIQPQMPAQPSAAQQMMYPGTPAMPAAAPAPAAVQAAPYYGVLPQAFQPQAAPAPAAVPQFPMTPAPAVALPGYPPAIPAAAAPAPTSYPQYGQMPGYPQQ